VALTTSSAIKAYLEAPVGMGGAGLGLSVYQDQAPENLPKPYITVDEAVAIIPDKLEDGAASTVQEHVTVHLWMSWKNLTAVGNPRLEDPTLAGKIAKALQGSRLLTSGTGAPPTTTYTVLVHSVGPRILERDANVVHVPLWCEVWRAA
jgi:hypothetical protein